ncbi:unnamed protein product [Meloidogyne enterolobii]|uniref:Uncharacterized protein n=1 Tax=Meloidogyne enterolobii TaxID=390850 RepID=A0ACB1AD87_MELEN
MDLGVAAVFNLLARVRWLEDRVLRLEFFARRRRNAVQVQEEENEQENQQEGVNGGLVLFNGHGEDVNIRHRRRNN